MKDPMQYWPDSTWWRRLRVMTWKELLQLMRDPLLLLFVVYAFSADIYNAASGVTLQLNNAALAVLDIDHSAASRELAGRLLAPEFRAIGSPPHAAAGQALLDNGRAMALLDIGPGFGAALARGEPAAVQLQVDASNSVQGFLIALDAGQIVARFGLESAAARLGLDLGATPDAPIIDNRIRVWFNPNQNDAWFMGISELLNVVTLFAMLLPAAAMVREKERGTIEQLLVSPLGPLQIMLPKMLAMVAVILCGTALGLLGLLVPVFGLPVQGSLPLFFGVATLYIATLAAIGILIATVTSNMAQAGMLVILILAPMIFLSGAWTPPEAMPALMHALMYLSPLYYFINASYGILLKGAGLATLWPMLAAILALGLAAGAACTLRFRRQFG